MYVIRHLTSRGSRRGVNLLRGGGLFDFEADMRDRVEERGQGLLTTSEEEMGATWLVPTSSNLSYDTYPYRQRGGARPKEEGVTEREN